MAPGWPAGPGSASACGPLVLCSSLVLVLVLVLRGGRGATEIHSGLRALFLNFRDLSSCNARRESAVSSYF